MFTICLMQVACVQLFTSLVQRTLEFRNRLVVSPMCQYSAVDGVPNAWQLVHLGSRAVGGAGAVFTEATAVCARGRISPGDTGLWNDAQLLAWQPIAHFIHAHGAVAGMQLAHAGRKSSTCRPWAGHGPLAPEQGRGSLRRPQRYGSMRRHRLRLCWIVPASGE